MELTEQIRNLLVCLTDGPIGTAQVEWYPGDAGHYDDSPTPAYLTMCEMGTYEPRVRFQHREGLKALMELLGTTEQEIENSKLHDGRTKYLVKRQDNGELRLVGMM